MLNRNLDCSQTVFALTTGSLPSAVAIVKVAGPEAFAISSKIFAPLSNEAFEKKAGVFFGNVKDLTGSHIDTCLALTFVAPKSHTGEDTVEFHLHGSIAIVQKLKHVLLDLGVRPAERGEFSYRALLNGKVSPEELDTLGDLFIARETEDLNQIYLRRDGSLQRKVGEIRKELLRLQAILDTAVDFADEYSSVVHLAKEPVTLAIHQITEIIQRYSLFREAKTVPKLVLAGLPNAGKSSLFNALLCKYRAIVHEEAGTTRDVIEEWLEIEGKTWKLVDTAGLREAETQTERQGIELGEAFLSSANFWILVVDGTRGLTKEEAALLDRFGGKPHLIVWNKMDLPTWSEPNEAWLKDQTVSVSAKEGVNLECLWGRLRRDLKNFSSLDDVPLASQTECSRLKNVLVLLKQLQEELETESLPEYMAEKNRQAIGQLESVIGHVGVDDVLDRVFGEFCIGK